MKRLISLFLLSCVATPLFALVGTTPQIRHVALVEPEPDSNLGIFSLIGEVPTGSVLILRTINKADGTFAAPDQTAFLPGGPVVSGILYSRVWQPQNILVLREDSSILAYPVAFDADGKPKLVGGMPLVYDPFFVDESGIATALAEAPGGFLGIGTSSGGLVLVNKDGVYIEEIELRKGEVTSLTTVPQVGYFAFVAVVGGHAMGVDPRCGMIVFDLADPRSRPLLNATGAVFEPNGDGLTKPSPVPIVAANGTRDVAELMIPVLGGTNADCDDPLTSIEGELSVGLISEVGVPVVEVDLGSLAMRTADGAVLLDPNFTLAKGGSGVALAVAGARLDFNPNTLNLRSRGNQLSAICNNENNTALEIDANTITLHYGGWSVLAIGAQKGDADRNGQADILVKFDRAAVQAMLKDAPEGLATLTLRWRFNDTSLGSASGVVRVKR